MKPKRPRITEMEPSTSHQGTTNSEVDTVNEDEIRQNPIHGNTYQVRLLTLFFCRAIQLEYNFRLTTEMKEAQKFDDVVFGFEDENGEIKYLLLQAKHKLDKRKTISADDLLNVTDKEYSLTKYFFSYRNAKREEVFKDGSIENVIISTNIDLDKKSLAKKKITFDEIHDLNYIFELEGVENPVKQYRFRREVSHVLKPMLVKYRNKKSADEVSKKRKGWPTDAIFDDEITNFLDCLVLVVISDDQIEEILKTRIAKNFDVNVTEHLFEKLLIKMVNLMESGKKNYSVTHKDGKELINQVLRGPPIWFGIKDPVSSFTGRLGYLEEIHAALQRGSTVISQSATISGLGGVGKSELARKYVSEHRKDFDDRFVWINAESYQSLTADFCELAEKFNIKLKNHDGTNRNIKSIVEAVYEIFSKKKSLFIFDNAEKRRSTEDGDAGIGPFLPPSQSNGDGLRILITSRNQNWGQIKSISLDTFTEEEAVEFIEKALKIKNDEQKNEVIELAKELQCFPLALQQAVAYISAENEGSSRVGKEFKISHYLELYQSKTEDLLNFPFPEESDNLYTKTVFTTWDITIEHIEHKKMEYGQEASEILNISSYFLSEGISSKIFLNMFVNDNDKSRKVGMAIQLLNQYSMVNSGQEPTILNIHRLVQEVVRIKIRNKNKEIEYLRKALELFENYLNPGNVDQAASVWEHATKHKELVDDFHWIAARVIEELGRMSRYREAQLHGEKALKVLQDQLGPNNSKCALIMEKKAIVLYHQGNAHDDALKNLQTVKEKLPDGNIPDEIDNTIGLILKDQRKYDEALEVFKSILKAERNPEAVLRAKQNMASVYSERGNYNEALGNLNEVLEARKHEKNPNHGDICSIILSMGKILEKQNHYSEALKFFEDAHNQLQKSSKPDDRRADLAIRHCIAKMKYYVRKYESSHKMFDGVLQERKKLLPDHPSTLETKCMMVLPLIELRQKTDVIEFVREITEEIAKFCSKKNKKKTQTNMNLERRSELRRCGFDVTILDEILSNGVSKGYCQIISSMLENGADINAANALLYLKPDNDDMEITASEDENNLGMGAKTAAQQLDTIIILKRCLEMTSKILEKPVCRDSRIDYVLSAPLHFAVMYNQTAALHVLLGRNAKVNVTDSQNLTPLHYAVMRSHVEIQVVNALLDKGAYVNAIAAGDITPLHVAAQEGHLEVVNALLGGGAYVNATAADDITPLHLAAQEGHLKVVNALLGRGANVNHTASYDFTPLHIAARQGHVEVVDALLNMGADVEATNSYDLTPLDLAAHEGHVEVVGALLEKSANVNATDPGHVTPLHLAASMGHVEVVNALLKMGADFNTTDCTQTTPLHAAVQNGHVKVVDALLEMGADVEAADRDNFTPLDYARLRGHGEILGALQKKKADTNASTI